MLNNKGFIVSESILLLLLICTLVSMLLTSVSLFQRHQKQRIPIEETEKIKDIYE